MSHKQHIIITSAWFPTTTSAKGVFVKEQAEGLANAGHEVTVLLVTMESFGAKFKGGTTSEQYLIPANCKLIVCRVRFPFQTRFKANRLEFEKAFVVQKVLRAIEEPAKRATIVHHHCLSDNAYVAKAIAETHHIPLVFTEHSNYTNDEELNKFNNYESFDDRRQFVQSCSVRLAVSQRWAEVYAIIYNTSFEVVPNMVGVEFMNPIVSKSCDTFTFCSVAGFDANKNQELMIRAFAIQFKGNQKIQLKLIGSGNRLNACKALAEELGVQAQVVFSGHLQRNEVKAAIDNSDVVISASHRETFGLILAEAMMRGKPVISTRSWGPESFVIPATGMLCEVKDDKEFGLCMKEMHMNYTKYSSTEIRTYAAGRFSPDVVVSLLVSCYEKAGRNR